MCLGLGNGCVPKEEKKAVSLLKPYTNFDRIKDMNLDEIAERFANVEFNIINEVYKTLDIPTDKSKFKNEYSNRKKEWKQYLESEAE